MIPVTLSETEALKYPPFQDIFYFDEIFSLSEISPKNGY